ncbi:hypothetical protein BDZ94DRAFT_1247929 [Collybia nuda]|uniref:Required for respiratory growth protein 9, mitochondrial n=1 Tax=Collybia nuda TaxID=64659 RepID=A0A9P5YDA2_9AGAR|nr:hypothetical protein BDZ94DRAFT_1247929 [Collybia nuda]
MPFWSRSISFASCRHTLSRLYSTDISSSSRQKWRLAGVPRPRSILDDDDNGPPVDLTEDNEVVNGARPNTPPPHLRRPPENPTPSEYKTHREVMRKNFPGGWSPPRKLSREAMEGVRQLHRLDPEKFTTPMLALQFKISPEAVRRILKSKWEPSKEKRTRLAEREREERSEFIKLSRVRERIEARRLAEIQKSTKSRSTVHDSFTFE